MFEALVQFHPLIYISWYTSWWFQPIWKISVKSGIFSSRFGMKINNIWNHHLDNITYALRVCWKSPSLEISSPYPQSCCNKYRAPSSNSPLAWRRSKAKRGWRIMPQQSLLEWYCWWKESCTSWKVVYPIFVEIYTSKVVQDFFHQQLIGKMVGKPLGVVPLIIKPIYTIYSGYLLGISSLWLMGRKFWLSSIDGKYI